MSANLLNVAVVFVSTLELKLEKSLFNLFVDAFNTFENLASKVELLCEIRLDNVVVVCNSCDGSNWFIVVKVLEVLLEVLLDTLLETFDEFVVEL